MKRISAVLLIITLIAALTACTKAPAAGKEGSPYQNVPALSAGDDFKLGDETYALEKWVTLPEYDTDTKIGYGLCFVQKEGIAPIAISGSNYTSLIDMKLDMDDGTLATSNISFIAVDDAPGYAARVTFEFALPKAAALPESGTIFHTGADKEERIDLSALETPAGAPSAPQEQSQPAVMPADDYEAKKLAGEWLLTAITFRTPETDNGIFSMDATMEISEGFEYGRNLSLRNDMTLIGLIDLSALIDAVNELPFSVTDLDFKDYSGWEYTNGVVTLTKSGPELAASYDEASEELRLTWSGTVQIDPAGEVLMDITMVFKAK
jgi:hypothetical protein